MSIDAAEYARLSDDSYNDRSKEFASRDPVTLKGSNAHYTVLAIVNNPKTDYQGTAYRRVDTGEVVIAHRGTEPNAKDAKTDASMVFNGRNSQLDDAVQFTERVMALAKQEAEKKGQPLSVSITGHSLGGTLAEITAAKTGLHAETFNAYGPKDLTHLGRYAVDVHAPHPNIVNHVRATDVVSAGGPHLGQVKIYAAQQDIESLRHGRYVGGSPLPGNPLLAADISAHSITNFLPGNKTLIESVMNPVNEARARAYAGPIALYRHDVMKGRIDLHTIANGKSPTVVVNGARLGVQIADAAHTVVAEKSTQAMVSGAQAVGHGVKAVGHAAGQAYDTTSTAVVHAADTTGKAIVSGAQSASRAAGRTYDATSTAVVHAAERTGKAVVFGARAAGHAAERTYDATREQVTTGTQRSGHALEQAGEAAREGAFRAVDKLTHPGSWFSSQTGPMPLLNDGHHPGNGLYKQALAGLDKINAERGIPSDQRTCNAAGTLAASACESRFKQIDHVVLNDNGSKLIAVQGQPGAALSKVIGVDTTVALNTPLAQSSQAFADAHNQQQNQRSQQVNQPVQAQTGPVLA
jgi:hypothetical protein